jgi:hypothetical protein
MTNDNNPKKEEISNKRPRKDEDSPTDPKRVKPNDGIPAPLHEATLTQSTLSNAISRTAYVITTKDSFGMSRSIAEFETAIASIPAPTTLGFGTETFFEELESRLFQPFGFENWSFTGNTMGLLYNGVKPGFLVLQYILS